jgi:hypothetical protein
MQMAGKFIGVCLGVIAFCKVFELVLDLIRYSREIVEEESDEPVPNGMYS